jgi:putative transposase
MHRVIVPGQPVHVIQRGNNRGQVFFTPKDGAYYLEWLDEAARKFGVAIHAYVLMTNHLHLLATPSTNEGLGKTMLTVGTRYTRYINTTQHRSGTLWEGRYRSSLITSDAYLLGCMRYIELTRSALA